jgi:hypothetical protein
MLKNTMMLCFTGDSAIIGGSCYGQGCDPLDTTNCLIKLFQAISVLINRGQSPIVFWRDPQFLSDSAHMGVNGAGGHVGITAPNIFQNVIPG